MDGRVSFEAMRIIFAIRDLFVPPRKKLGEVPVTEGMNILDFGCGPGSLSVAAADIVGPLGWVYALDANPLAIERVRRTSERKGLSNVSTILSDCRTLLESESIDVVILHDVFHELAHPTEVLEEIHRVLKHRGLLAFSDHHMNYDSIFRGVTKGRLFYFMKKKKYIYLFGVNIKVK